MRRGAAAAITRRHVVGERRERGRRQGDVELVGHADAGDRLGHAPRGSATGGPARRRRRRPPTGSGASTLAEGVGRLAAARPLDQEGHAAVGRRAGDGSAEGCSTTSAMPSPRTASTASRPATPARSAATSAIASSTVGTRGQHDDAVGRSGHEAQARRRHDAERALAADQQPGEVVAGVVLHQPVEVAHHGAVAQHRLDAEHLGAHGAVAQHADAAGVGGHHAADRRAVPRGEVDAERPAGGVGVGVQRGEGRRRRRRSPARRGRRRARSRSSRRSDSTTAPSPRRRARRRRRARCCRPAARWPRRAGAPRHDGGHLVDVEPGRTTAAARRGSGRSSRPRSRARTSASVRTWSAPTMAASAASSAVGGEGTSQYGHGQLELVVGDRERRDQAQHVLARVRTSARARRRRSTPAARRPPSPPTPARRRS